MGEVKRVRFGMPTPMECGSYDELLTFCVETGFDFIELNCNFPLYTREAMSSHRLLSRLREKGIGYSIHLPEVLDLGSLQSEFRDAALSMITSLVSEVEEGTRFVCHMNSGIKVSLPQEGIYIYERYEHAYLDSLEMILGALDAVLGDNGCVLCMENRGNFNLPFIQKGLQMLLSFEHIGLTWDFGHDTTAKLVDAPFFAEHMEKVFEIHLHDSKDGSDHRALYTGTVDIDNALTLATDQDIPVVVEVKTLEGLRASCRALQARGYMR